MFISAQPSPAPLARRSHAVPVGAPPGPGQIPQPRPILILGVLGENADQAFPQAIPARQIMADAVVGEHTDNALNLINARGGTSGEH